MAGASCNKDEIMQRFKHVGISLEIRPNLPRADVCLPYSIWCLKGDRNGFLEWLEEVKKQTDMDLWRKLESYLPVKKA
jgi:hypothetical protein